MQMRHSDIIEEIIDWHRKRRAAMEMRKRTDLALGANLRLWLGWRRELEADEADRIKQLAADLVDCGEKLAKGKKHELADGAEYLAFGQFIRMTIDARKPTDEFEKIATDKLTQLAKELPVWAAFGEAVKGFGPVSLATIIGEAGDLAAYSTHSKLWRRMGMAPYTKDGVTRSGQRWKVKGGLNADDWVAFGYSGRRRSLMYVIEESLIRQGDRYHRAYTARKEALRLRAEAEGKRVVPSAKIPKAQANAFIAQGQIAAQAKHYLGKRLLRDLWQAWRRANYHQPEMACRRVPAAENGEANGYMRADANGVVPLPQRATVFVPEMAERTLPAASIGEAAVALPNSASGRVPLRKQATCSAPKKAKNQLPAAKTGAATLPLHKRVRRAVPLRSRTKAEVPETTH
jgi:hypothetical protein